MLALSLGPIAACGKSRPKSDRAGLGKAGGAFRLPPAQAAIASAASPAEIDDVVVFLRPRTDGYATRP